MKTTIYLIRHSQLENPKKILYGRLAGFDLSVAGKKNAAKLGNYFKDKEIDYIYSSPLLRTKKTARAIKKYHKKIGISTSDLLNEWDIKQWEGKEAIKIKEYKYLNQDLSKIDFGSSETAEDVKIRMLKKISQILERHSGKDIVVISHGGNIKILRAALEKKKLKRLNSMIISYSSISKLVFEGDKLVKSEYKEVVPRLKETV